MFSECAPASIFAGQAGQVSIVCASSLLAKSDWQASIFADLCDARDVGSASPPSSRGVVQAREYLPPTCRGSNVPEPGPATVVSNLATGLPRRASRWRSLWLSFLSSHAGTGLSAVISDLATDLAQASAAWRPWLSIHFQGSAPRRTMEPP